MPTLFILFGFRFMAMTMNQFNKEEYNSSLKSRLISNIGYAAIAANSISSLTSLSFKLLFGLILDNAINSWSRKALCIMVLIDTIENGLLYLIAYAFAKLTVARDALKLKFNLFIFLHWLLHSPVYPLASRKKLWETSHNLFKQIRQHLKFKSFWGTTESVVRIQIYSTITAYCMVAIVEHGLQLHRSTYEVLRILSDLLLDKTLIKELFIKDTIVINDGQLSLNLF